MLKKVFICLSLLSLILLNHPVFSETAKLEIKYGGSCQFEIIHPQGFRVFFDVAFPSLLSSPPTAKDFLLTTHTHSDHYRANFADGFPGQKITAKVSSLRTAEIYAKCLSSYHQPDEPVAFRMLPEGGTNYLFLLETAGIRIAHLGDIGQKEFTQEQLKEFGQIDIAFAQLSSEYCDMNMNNKTGFILMEQLKPKLVIVTNMEDAYGLPDPEVIKYAAEKWEAHYKMERSIQIGKEDLHGKIKFLVFPQNPKILAFCKEQKIPEANW